MLSRRFVCPTCGDEAEFAAAFAEGEVPVCCGFEMEELAPEGRGGPRWAQSGMSARRMPRTLSRRFRCPRCAAQPGQKCKRVDGSEREASHVERVRYADQVMAETRATRAARRLDPTPPRRAN